MVDNDVVKVESYKRMEMHEWKYFIHFDGCLHMLTTLLPGIKDIQVVFFLKQ